MPAVGMEGGVRGNRTARAPFGRRVMIAVTRAKGREMGLKPLSVVVLDAGGHVLAFEREDGASPGGSRSRAARPMAR
jgi:uncharacterized protein GlcG (DUF336 family)